MAGKLGGAGVLDKADEDRVNPASTVKSEESEVGVVDGVDEKSLLRKLDRNLLPAVGILYLLSFLDRSNGKSTGGCLVTPLCAYS